VGFAPWRLSGGQMEGFELTSLLLSTVVYTEAELAQKSAMPIDFSILLHLTDLYEQV
jgi:hypothetical protein